MFSNEKLFEIALNLQEPWYVKRIEFDPAAGELHMHIDFHKGSPFPCPVCGQQVKAHDTKEQTWRHLNFFQYKAYIYSRTPRSNCPTDGVHLVSVPWSRPGSEFTLLFEALVLALAGQMPVLAVARIVDEHDTSFGGSSTITWKRPAPPKTFRRSGTLPSTKQRACAGRDTSRSSHDTDARRVLYAIPGREAFTVGCFAKDLTAHEIRSGSKTSSATCPKLSCTESKPSSHQSHGGDRQVPFDEAHERGARRSAPLRAAGGRGSQEYPLRLAKEPAQPDRGTEAPL